MSERPDMSLRDRTLDAMYFLLDAPGRLRTRLLRRRLLRQFRRVGTDFRFDPHSVFGSPERLEVGDHVFIGARAYISSDVRIGDHVMFGADASLIAGDHHFAVRGRSVRFLHPRGDENREPITIEDEVWCGASVIVLGGVTVGAGAVVGAGSVVRRSLPPYVVAVGSPARPVRRIFDDVTLEAHLRELGRTPAAAAAVVTRRRAALEALGLADLPVVDRTADYWEFRGDGA